MSARPTMVLLGALALCGCGESSAESAGDGTSTGAGSGGDGEGGAGSGGAAEGGSGTGTAVGGSGGATGMGGSGVGGAGVGGGDAFWPGDYDPSGSPSPAGGKHNAGKNCLGCHTAGGPASDEQWLFGGTVYQADGTTPAAHVQVAVRSGADVYAAYSATNGNFWYPAGPQVDWSTAEIRMRNGAGEATMGATATGGGCASCHTGALVLIEP